MTDVKQRVIVCDSLPIRVVGMCQMLYLERNINSTFIGGFNELKTIVSEADVASEVDLAPPPSPSPSPSSAGDNSTDDGSNDADVEETPVVSAGDRVRGWSDSALEAVNKLSDDLEAIKWKANRVSFDILHDYGDQYGFFRLVVFLNNIIVRK